MPAYRPRTVTLMEGHGTSTSVGDTVEVKSMATCLAAYHLPAGSWPGLVKSQYCHLKGAARCRIAEAPLRFATSIAAQRALRAA